MKYWIVIIAALFLASCKTKAGMVNTNSVTPYVVDENELTSKKVIENHYNNKRDFSTLYIRSSAKYRDDKQSQNVSAEIKIKKDLVLFSDKIQTMDIELIEPLFYDQTSLKYFLDDKKNINQQFINNLIWIIKNEEYEINLLDDSSYVLNAGTNTKNIGDFTKGYYFFIETKACQRHQVLVIIQNATTWCDY